MRLGLVLSVLALLVSHHVVGADAALTARDLPGGSVPVGASCLAIAAAAVAAAASVRGRRRMTSSKRHGSPGDPRFALRELSTSGRRARAPSRRLHIEFAVLRL